MATAGDGATPYQSGGAGGKFRKKPIRRSTQATPYDRPPTALRNSSPSLFAKLVDPASRLIYAGADRLFGVFRKRIPSIAAPRPPETREEPKPITDEGGNLATTEISDLESILKQKTFTRSEIEYLTALLNAKTANSDDNEGDIREKIPTPSSHFLRLEASTSKQQHVDEREKEKENIHAAISTPVVTSRAFEEDVASPAELARAYMGSRTPKVSPTTLRFGSQQPRQDSVLLNTTTILQKTPRTTTSTFKTYENGFTTPRSRGRSAIYSMARTPYSKPPSTFLQKGINSPPLPLSQEGSIESSKMTSSIYKRRSSVLDDIGSGGPVRRIRQKANLLSQGSPVIKNRTEFSQKLLLRNEEEKGETSVRSNLGYGSVPTKSTQVATKILEQLETLSPKEKSPVSRLAKMNEKLPVKEKVDSPSSLKLISSCQDNSNKKGESLVVDARESSCQSKGKEKVEENGPSRKFAVPRNVLNGNAGVVLRDNGPIESTFKVPSEPPQKKRFQMSAHEGVEVDDDSRSNGHVFGGNKKTETSVFGNKDVSAEVNKALLASQVEKVPETQKNGETKSLLKTNFGSVNGSVANKKVTFNFSQPDEIKETVAPQNKAPVFPTFSATTKNTEIVPPFPDAKPFASTSLFSSVKENNEDQSKKEDVGNAVNVFNKSEALPTASPTPTFLFGGNSNNTSNGASSPLTFSFSASSTATASLPSAPTPIFNFGSSTKDKDPTTNSLFATGGSSIFGFSSPAPTSTTQPSLFNTTTNPTPVPSTTSGTSLFGSSAPTFGFGSTPATSETKPASPFTTTPIFGLNSTPTTTAFTFGAPSTTSSPPVFGASSSSMFSFTAANSTPSQSQPQPLFGSPNNNNDQMSMDSMAEDSTPTPSFTSFGQPSTPPFMFGGQTNQQPPPFQASGGVHNPFQASGGAPNPFQASGSGDFSAGGGSFSLGSGGGDKSGRRILKVRKNRNK